MSRYTNNNGTRRPKEITTKLPAWMGHLGDWMLRVRGWKRIGEAPKDLRFVATCAPHTSNWDVWYFLGLAWGLRVRARYMVKHSLFWWPLGIFMRWTGGVPVDRTSRKNAVQQVVEMFEEYETFVLGVAAEGTRKKAKGWKTGFYWIAVEAKIPIMMAYLDYGRKEAGIGPMFWPTGDIEADFKHIQAFYADKQAKYEDQRGPVVIDSPAKTAPEPPADRPEEKAQTP